MTHELGPAVTDAHVAFVVYKDYDGEAPDTGDLAVCATRALAEEVAEWCGKNESKFGRPFSDGHEWASRYDVYETIARAAGIARTLEAALAQLGYEPGKYPQLVELLRLLGEAGLDPESYDLTEETADEIPVIETGDLWVDATEQAVRVYRGVDEVVLETEDLPQVVAMLAEEQRRWTAGS